MESVLVHEAELFTQEPKNLAHGDQWRKHQRELLAIYFLRTSQ